MPARTGSRPDNQVPVAAPAGPRPNGALGGTGTGFRSDRFVLFLCVFAMGACGLAYEYTLSKIASDLMGNSVRQWAIVIGVMMFFMGIGADLQKYFSDRALLDKFIAVEILLGVFGGVSPLLLLFAYGAAPSHYTLVYYGCISSIGLLIGLEIPLLARVNASYSPKLGENLGGVLKMDYAGALIGALLWVFLLPRFFSMIETALVLGVINLVIAAMALYHFRLRIRGSRAMGAFIGVCLVIQVFLFTQADAWTSHAEQYLYRDRIIHSQSTPYQHIVMTRNPSGDLFCYINGNLQFSSVDEHIYHELLVHPAMHVAARRRRVLILGGGDGLALREVLKYPDVREVVLCDLDSAVTSLARRHPDLVALNQGSLSQARVTSVPAAGVAPGESISMMVPNQNRPYRSTAEASAEVKLMHLDAAKLVETLPGVFDVILLDFPDPNSPELAKLYSTSFYGNLRHKLAREGIFSQQSTSPVHAREAFLCIGRTMAASGLHVLPYRDNVPTFGEWGWWLGSRDDGPPESILRESLLNLEKMQVATRYLDPELVRASLAFPAEWLHTENKDLNTLVRPVVHQLYLKAWSWGS